MPFDGPARPFGDQIDLAMGRVPESQKKKKKYEDFADLSKKFLNSYVDKMRFEEMGVPSNRARKREDAIFNYNDTAGDLLTGKEVKASKGDILALQNLFVQLRDQHTVLQIKVEREQNDRQRKFLKHHLQELEWRLQGVAHQLDLMNEPHIPSETNPTHSPPKEEKAKKMDDEAVDEWLQGQQKAEDEKLDEGVSEKESYVATPTPSVSQAGPEIRPASNSTTPSSEGGGTSLAIDTEQSFNFRSFADELKRELRSIQEYLSSGLEPLSHKERTRLHEMIAEIDDTFKENRDAISDQDRAELSRLRKSIFSAVEKDNQNQQEAKSSERSDLLDRAVPAEELAVGSGTGTSHEVERLNELEKYGNQELLARIADRYEVIAKELDFGGKEYDLHTINQLHTLATDLHLLQQRAERGKEESSEEFVDTLVAAQARVDSRLEAGYKEVLERETVEQVQKNLDSLFTKAKDFQNRYEQGKEEEWTAFTLEARDLREEFEMLGVFVEHLLIANETMSLKQRKLLESELNTIYKNIVYQTKVIDLGYHHKHGEHLEIEPGSQLPSLESLTQEGQTMVEQYRKLNNYLEIAKNFKSDEKLISLHADLVRLSKNIESLRLDIQYTSALGKMDEQNAYESLEQKLRTISIHIGREVRALLPDIQKGMIEQQSGNEDEMTDEETGVAVEVVSGHAEFFDTDEERSHVKRMANIVQGLATGKSKKKKGLLDRLAQRFSLKDRAAHEAFTKTADMILTPKEMPPKERESLVLLRVAPDEIEHALPNERREKAKEQNLQRFEDAITEQGLRVARFKGDQKEAVDIDNELAGIAAEMRHMATQHEENFPVPDKKFLERLRGRASDVDDIRQELADMVTEHEQKEEQKHEPTYDTQVGDFFRTMTNPEAPAHKEFNELAARVNDFFKGDLMAAKIELSRVTKQFTSLQNDGSDVVDPKALYERAGNAKAVLLKVESQLDAFEDDLGSLDESDRAYAVKSLELLQVDLARAKRVLEDQLRAIDAELLVDEEEAPVAEPEPPVVEVEDPEAVVRESIEQPGEELEKATPEENAPDTAKPVVAEQVAEKAPEESPDESPQIPGLIEGGIADVMDGLDDVKSEEVVAASSATEIGDEPKKSLPEEKIAEATEVAEEAPVATKEKKVLDKKDIEQLGVREWYVKPIEKPKNNADREYNKYAERINELHGLLGSDEKHEVLLASISAAIEDAEEMHPADVLMLFAALDEQVDNLGELRERARTPLKKGFSSKKLRRKDAKELRGALAMLADASKLRIDELSKKEKGLAETVPFVGDFRSLLVDWSEVLDEADSLGGELDREMGRNQPREQYLQELKEKMILLRHDMRELQKTPVVKEVVDHMQEVLQEQGLTNGEANIATGLKQGFRFQERQVSDAIGSIDAYLDKKKEKIEESPEEGEGAEVEAQEEGEITKKHTDALYRFLERSNEVWTSAVLRPDRVRLMLEKKITNVKDEADRQALQELSRMFMESTAQSQDAFIDWVISEAVSDLKEKGLKAPQRPESAGPEENAAQPDKVDIDGFAESFAAKTGATVTVEKKAPAPKQAVEKPAEEPKPVAEAPASEQAASSTEAEEDVDVYNITDAQADALDKYLSRIKLPIGDGRNEAWARDLFENKLAASRAKDATELKKLAADFAQMKIEDQEAMIEHVLGLVPVAEEKPAEELPETWATREYETTRGRDLRDKSLEIGKRVNNMDPDNPEGAIDLVRGMIRDYQHLLGEARRTLTYLGEDYSEQERTAIEQIISNTEKTIVDLGDQMLQEFPDHDLEGVVPTEKIPFETRKKFAEKAIADFEERLPHYEKRDRRSRNSYLNVARNQARAFRKRVQSLKPSGGGPETDRADYEALRDRAQKAIDRLKIMHKEDRGEELTNVDIE